MNAPTVRTLFQSTTCDEFPQMLYGIKYLTANEKIAYMIIYNCLKLSANNPNFIDENGEVYCIMKRESLAEKIGRCSDKTAGNCLDKLEKLSFISRKKLGDKKPDLIYLNLGILINTANLLKDSSEERSLKSDV